MGCTLYLSCNKTTSQEILFPCYSIYGISHAKSGRLCTYQAVLGSLRHMGWTSSVSLWHVGYVTFLDVTLTRRAEEGLYLLEYYSPECVLVRLLDSPVALVGPSSAWTSCLARVMTSLAESHPSSAQARGSGRKPI